jgi:Tfp pilus assembly protein FimT
MSIDRPARVCDERGYSIIELLMGLGILMVVSSMALFQFGQTRPIVKGDGAMRVVMAQLTSARELAITQRRYMRVTFTGTNVVNVIREDTPTTTTQLSSVPFEGGVNYALVTGLPDSPDTFGKSAAVDFGSVTNVKFTPDGTLVNQDGTITNGTVFLALNGLRLSARAITVLGSTGRIRGYRWNGAAWTLK